MKAWEKGTILGVLYILTLGIIYAAPMAPQPSCAITAEIVQVQFIEAHVRECLMDEREYPSKYELEVRMTENGSTSPQEGSWDPICEDISINSTKILTIYESKIKNGDVFRKSQIINGTINSRGDECYAATYLDDYHIIYQGEVDDIIATTEPPTPLPAVTTPLPEPEEKAACGPTLLIALALIPLALKRKCQ